MINCQQFFSSGHLNDCVAILESPIHSHEYNYINLPAVASSVYSLWTQNIFLSDGIEN